jgi:hypothetical protein
MCSADRNEREPDDEHAVGEPLRRCCRHGESDRGLAHTPGPVTVVNGVEAMLSVTSRISLPLPTRRRLARRGRSRPMVAATPRTGKGSSGCSLSARPNESSHSATAALATPEMPRSVAAANRRRSFAIRLSSCVANFTWAMAPAFMLFHETAAMSSERVSPVEPAVCALGPVVALLLRCRRFARRHDRRSNGARLRHRLGPGHAESHMERSRPRQL